MPENRRMSRTWQLLRPDRSETPSISISNRDDVKKICDWSAIRVKAEKFEEVEFDNLVTEENLRQFLGYNIPRDKKMITKRGAVKKRGEAPPSPRPVTKKRHFSGAEEVPEDVPLRKKRVIPLAASGVKRTPPRVSIAGSNTKEGPASFWGFVLEVSPIQEAVSTPAFGLRDESGFEASYQGPETSFEETNAGASTVASLVPERSEEEGKPRPEAHNVQATRRVKHLARKKKFGARDRLAEIISEVERMWDNTKEPLTGTPERDNTEEPRSSQQVGDRGTPDAGLEVRSADQSKASQHLGEPEGHRVNTVATTTEADLHPETSNRDKSHTEASTSELRPNDSVAASNMGAAQSVGPSSSSRVSMGFEVLGRGLLGHPMEAIKNLIPEGFLGNARVSSPERIAQGILISHYQVSFQN